MIVATLPPSPPTLPREGKKPSKHSSSSNSAWERSTSKTSPSLSSRAQGKQPQLNSLPNESFVLLQDSVVRAIPSSVSPTPRAKKGSLKSRNDNAKSVDAQAPTHFEPDSNPSPLSHHLRSTARLFNLLSARTEIDHPLCAECTQILLTTLQRQLDETKKERDGYIAFEKEVRKEREKDIQGLTKDEADKKVEKLKTEEHLAIEQLKEAERERQQLDEELRLLEWDEKAVEAEEAESGQFLVFQFLSTEFSPGSGEFTTIICWVRNNKLLS
jgi:beclin